MNKPCTGLCKHLDTRKAVGCYVGKLFTLGWKRCSNCEIMIQTLERFCPCCHTMLGWTPKRTAEWIKA